MLAVEWLSRDAMHKREAEIIFECTRLGSSVRMVAVDAQTGAEAAIVAPVNTHEYHLKTLALRKLERVRERQY